MKSLFRQTWLVLALTAPIVMAQNGTLPQPSWPERVKAAKGAPNIVLILLDDVGFGAASVFGGAIATPALDKLAAGGLRYNRFHVNALCSPTRAALLSGRNDHQIGFGTVAEVAVGFPGYNSIWPKNAVSVAEVLKRNGYSTAAFGKWHNTPAWEINPSGPFDHWPTSLGFEYYYGFLGGQDSQWYPRLYRNTTAVEPPSKPSEGYHLTTDLANDAIRWVRQHDSIVPQKPFFLYFATGAAHTPHHVAPEWIARQKGKFDRGWDELRKETFARQKRLGVIPASAELTTRPPSLPSWESIAPEKKKLLVRQMEVYAAFLEQTDYEIGRLLDAVRGQGHVEDTVVLYIVGDNGASAEGTLEGRDSYASDGKASDIEARLKHIDDLGSEKFFNHYAAAWAWATNTPFQYSKQVASHLGGTRDPLIISWPGHIKDSGGLRSQFHHVNDIAPTLYEIAGVKFPESIDGVRQLPLEGTSLAYTFDRPNDPGRHKVQYFEMLGHRGIYKDGWWAASHHTLPWEGGLLNGLVRDPLNNEWELYNLENDYSQAHNLASQNPEKLKELQQLFDTEAQRNHVYPLVPYRALLSAGAKAQTTAGTSAARAFQPAPGGEQSSFVYGPSIQRLPPASAPRLAGRAHRITAEVTIADGAEGVIVAQGGRYGGFSLYVKDGRVAYEVNAFGNRTARIVSNQPLASGKVEIVLSFAPQASAGQVVPLPGFSYGPGVARLMVNGVPAGESVVTTFGGTYAETFDIGSDLGTAVSPGYASPFAFTGTITAVKVDLQ